VAFENVFESLQKRKLVKVDFPIWHHQSALLGLDVCAFYDTNDETSAPAKAIILFRKTRPQPSLVAVVQCCRGGDSMETVAPSARYPSPVRPGRTRVGWIGVGFMGAHMAARLQSAGYSLSVFARTPSKALPLIQAGARLAASPADVARHSDVVFTIVSHPSDVRSLALGPDGLLSAGPGLVVVDMTTSSPALAREIAAAARSGGCWAVDAPVSGGDAGAREGRLAIFAGGEEGVVEWLSPLFETMGKPTRMGGAGCGQHAKLANQVVVAANLLGLSEAAAFAGRAGLDCGAFVAAVGAGAAGSRVMELFAEKMVGRDFVPGGFSEYMVKDLGMALTTEEEGGGDGGGGRGGEALALPGAALCRQLFQAMVANGDGKMGIQGLLTVLDRINNNKREPETMAPSAYYPIPVLPGHTRVGWIGVGLMGFPMAARLQRAGYSLSVFARNPSKALPLTQAGARLAASPADLARHSDVVFTIVSHPSDVRSLTLGPDGLLSAGPGLVVVDMTTSFPALAREIAAAARSRGCWAVDAPVSGADAGAKEGRLAIFAGGEEGVVKWLTPLFEIMGKPARMGGAGCGQHAKLANQIVGVANLLGMSEALMFAGRAGLDPGAFLAAVRAGAAGSRLMELFGEKMVARDFAPGGFSEYLVKDLGMALTTEEEEEDRGGDGGGGRGGTALVLPGAALCRQLFQAMVANGDGKMGIHGVLTVLERINNDKKDPEFLVE
ncbi:hypothetical protein Taro_016607, partial [Colocasia esculenta]|nr:hypothetical protein [Colocasia esculenta]